MGKRAEVTIIMGVDPGKTTGVAVVRASGPSKAEVLKYAQVDIEDAPRYFADALDYYTDLSVISMERFTISARTLKASRQSDPLDVIGGVKFLVALHDRDIQLFRFGPSDAKTAYSDKRLKALGLFSAVAGTHARDALRHAMMATHKLYSAPAT